MIRAQTRPLVRLRLLQEAQQKHHEGQNGTIDAAAMAAGNPEMNGRNKANKKTNTIVTLSDSPLIQEHKVSWESTTDIHSNSKCFDNR